MKLLLLKLIRDDRENSNHERRLPDLLTCMWSPSPWCRGWGCGRGWGASPRPPGECHPSGARPGSWWPGGALTTTSETDQTFKWSNYPLTWTDTFKISFILLNLSVTKNIFTTLLVESLTETGDGCGLRGLGSRVCEREAEPGQEPQVSGVTTCPHPHMVTQHRRHCRTTTTLPSHVRHNLQSCFNTFEWWLDTLAQQHKVTKIDKGQRI